MKIMVVGGGGREHAIIKGLKKNPEITEIYDSMRNDCKDLMSILTATIKTCAV